MIYENIWMKTISLTSPCNENVKSFYLYLQRKPNNINQMKLVVYTLLAFMAILGVQVPAKTYSPVRVQPYRKHVRPLELYGRFFTDISANNGLFGNGKLFSESKTFADIVPKRSVEHILTDWSNFTGSDTVGFIKDNFMIPVLHERKMDNYVNIDTYIKAMWNFLTFPPDTVGEGTRIPMSHDYFVPGGRFREMYYWDSYFSMLGMLVDNEHALVMSMLNNFADCIRSLGFIPNGMRTYYLGRSQPPFFSYMVAEAARYYGNEIMIRYLPEMEAEYNYWMQGADSLSTTRNACLHVVRMPDGEILNRYYDKYNTPREEAWRPDMETAALFRRAYSKESCAGLFRNLRAAAESGIDFSSRWLADGRNLYTIRTTELVPIDLNSLLCHLEQTISEGYKLKGDMKNWAVWKQKEKLRSLAIRKYFWSSKQQWYCDVELGSGKHSPYLSLAGMYPLYVGTATRHQARQAVQTFNRLFLKAGGAVTTPYTTGQQWDAPNGWAPLQWISFKGLIRYRFTSTASLLRSRWLKTCLRGYKETGTLKEKYNVVSWEEASGGEYATQIGFGWTNGVYKALENYVEDHL